MLRLLFIRFWPVFVPLVLYTLWLGWRRRRAKQLGHPVPAFRDGPWLWMVVSMLGIGILCFLWLGLSSEHTGSEYVPAHMEDGRLLEGEVE